MLWYNYGPVVKLKTHTLLHVVETCFSCIFVVLYCVCVCLPSVCTICKCNSVTLCSGPYILSFGFVCVCIHEWQMLLWNKVYKHTLSSVQLQLQVQMCFKSQRVMPCGFFWGLRRGHERVRLRPTQPGVFLSRERVLIHTTLLIFPHHSPGQLHAEDIYLLYLMMETLSNMFWFVS